MFLDIVVISGYFCAPLKKHQGYQEYIALAKKMGNIVIAIHANDNQCKRKYGKKMPRQMFPDCYNVIAIDKDDTVRETLTAIRKCFFTDRVIFFKDGGEYNKENLPEYGIEGVEYFFGISPKRNSSSKILGLNKKEC